MALFDSIAAEAREKFDIGDKANALLSVLLAMVSDKGNGGFSGFLESFREAGLGDLASSWVNSSANMPISYEQTESVFSEQTLRQMSEETGIDYKTTTFATAFMIPHIIDELTPNGEIPNERGLRTMLGGSLSGEIGTAAGTGGGNAPEISAAGENFNDNASENSENSLLRVLLPLILIGILIALGYMFCMKPSEKTSVMDIKTNANTNANANRAVSNSAVVAPNTSTVKTVDSSFTLRAQNGRYVVSGVVPDAATEKQIKDALTAQYGAESLDFAGLRVEAGAGAFGAGWWSSFTQLLPSLKGWTAGELAFAGNEITAASGLPQEAIDRIKTLFGAGWRVPVSIAGEANAAKQANAEALSELAAARTVGQVVEAMNVSIINFASGSSAIPADAQSVLQKAAEVLKAQPADTRIEIGGYTDSDGNDDANLKLSESRAGSVKNELVKLGVSPQMLLARGYGESDPVAANDTPDNKFKNRRIAYKVVSGDGSTTKTETKTSN